MSEKKYTEYKIFKFFVGQTVFINLLTLFILGVGGLIGVTMVKEAFPAISFDIVLVTTVYPGATPEDVERLVSVPIERSLKSVDGIDEYSSYSVENRSTVVIQVDPDHPSKDKVVRDIERAVDRVRTSELPADGDEPMVFELKADHPVLSVAISGQVDEMHLREVARALENDFVEIEGVADVNRSNYRKQEIWVEGNLEKLDRHHLSLGDISDAIRVANHNSQGGKMEIGGRETLIRTQGNLITAEDVADVIVRSNEEGHLVRVRDVATVADRLERKTFETRVNGKPAINLTIRKKPTGDALKIKDEIVKVLDKWESKVGEQGIAFETTDDITFYIKRRLDVLLRNGTTGMVMVIISLFFFLSPRSALWTTLAIPFAYLGGLIYMYHAGLTVNLLSLFSFILVSGMLVDDGIVVAEHYERLREEGLPPRKAASVAASEMAFPVTAAVMTTIIAFMPLAFVAGITGKFLRQFPIVVVAVLIVDLFECLFVLPNHLAHFGKSLHIPNFIERFRSKGPAFMSWLTDRYEKPLRWSLAHPWTGMFLFGILLFGSFGVSMKYLKFVMFPVDADQIILAIELPIGTPLEVTSQKAALLEAVAQKLPSSEVTAVITEVGVAGEESKKKRGTNVAQLKFLLDNSGLRKRSGEKVLEDIRPELEAIAKREGFIEFEIRKAERGPPSGKAIDFRIIGDNLDELRSLSNDVQAFLATRKGAFGVNDDLDEGKPEILLDVNRSAAARSKILPGRIAQTIRSAFSGDIATEIKRSDVEEDIEVRVKLPESARQDKRTLDRLTVTSPSGRRVPLTRLVTMREDVGLLSIVRQQGKRSIRVQGDINRELNSVPKVAAEVATFLDERLKAHPGFSYEFGGEESDRRKSMVSLRKAMAIAVLVIYIMLASLFQSFLQPFIILSILPFAFAGTFLTLLAHGLPLSMLVLIGLTGLMGVVVNNSILIVESIRREGRYAGEVPDIETVIRACRTRLRPILLTSVTTFFGVAPLGYGIGGSEPFLAHTALTFGWGLLFCGCITLFLVPTVYAFSWKILRWFGQEKSVKVEVDA